MLKNTFTYPFLSKNLSEKKIKYKKLFAKAKKNNIYFASLSKSDKDKIKKYDLVKLKKGKIPEVLKKDKLAVFFVKRDHLISPKLPPLGFASLVLSEALKLKYKGPLYLALDLEINPKKYLHTLKKEVNIAKKQIKNARSIGIFNINIDLSSLGEDLVKQVSSNLKSFALFLEEKSQKQPVWTKDNVFYKTQKQKIKLNYA